MIKKKKNKENNNIKPEVVKPVQQQPTMFQIEDKMIHKKINEINN